MKIIRSNYKTPYLNFALEELLLKSDELSSEDILLIYQNENAIIVGRNQNTHEEINDVFVKDNKISIARRLSGGGAVYQDEGNVNFCFITHDKESSYTKFLEPIIGFLNSLGLHAVFTGKNDVTIDDIKISGNAQYKYKHRMFHHGTLLFNSDLFVLGSALKPNKLKLQSKSIKSARQRVSNIRDLMNPKINTENFIQKLISYFQAKNYELINQDIITEEDINQLAELKSSPNWNFSKNPDFEFKNTKRFSGGTITLKISTNNNKISHIKIEGDFLSTNDFEDIYKFFIGKTFDLKTIKKIFTDINNFSDYFGKITANELLTLFNKGQDV
ncbi:lipoate--protein ligase [Candidatus Mycoplasma mahonii]|uniref:lipoate--protein ligase n=1 Tax=Candidatus Mycoplasma mahonii TaxID=3004105 RepID=UPI0026EA0E70|nr:lipoate--protein ligase [Candidatus Mycoplasma mahonii]WKX02448.1 lipoate--protein ligase [Candidatus Mycoplasma mahonii]